MKALSTLKAPEINNYIIYITYKILLNRHLIYVGLINDTTSSKCLMLALFLRFP